MVKKGDQVTLNVAWFLVPDGLVWVFQKLLIYRDFHTQHFSKIYREWSVKETIQKVAVVWTKMPCWCQRSGENQDRLVRDDRKATVTQITIRYNQVMQNTISERTTHRTLKQMGYSSRRPHQVFMFIAKKNIKKYKNWVQFLLCSPTSSASMLQISLWSSKLPIECPDYYHGHLCLLRVHL